MKKLLTLQQPGELLQVSHSTLYEWTHAGFIPHYKFPKGMRFHRKEVADWLRKHKRKRRSSYKLNIQLKIR